MLSTPLTGRKQTAAVPRGWLFPAVHSKIIRFVSETKVEGNHGVYIPFQTSGFIYLLNDTFSISVAQPNEVLLFKYKDGFLSRMGSAPSTDWHPRRLSFANAVSGVLDEFVCEGIGDFWRKVVSHHGEALKTYEKSGSLSSGARFEAVVGDGPGDLQKFTVTLPNLGGGVEKTFCTFTVILP